MIDLKSVVDISIESSGEVVNDSGYNMLVDSCELLSGFIKENEVSGLSTDVVDKEVIIELNGSMFSDYDNVAEFVKVASRSKSIVFVPSEDGAMTLRFVFGGVFN